MKISSIKSTIVSTALFSLFINNVNMPATWILDFLNKNVALEKFLIQVALVYIIAKLIDKNENQPSKTA